MKYAIHRTDGGVSIMVCANATVRPEDEIAKWAQPLRDSVVSIAPIADADIPQDRTFRDGWALNGGKIVHDMAKCREVHREHMRAARAPKLAALDVQFIRAVEAGDKVAQAKIAADKQALRDVTADPAIEAAATPDALKAVWPDILR
jgi:hypothetical protein